jgi:hypothetical protein
MLDIMKQEFYLDRIKVGDIIKLTEFYPFSFTDKNGKTTRQVFQSDPHELLTVLSVEVLDDEAEWYQFEFLARDGIQYAQLGQDYTIRYEIITNV